jgi:MtfA peptidase
VFGFLRKRRRRRMLDEPFPQHWDAILRRNVGHYSRLSPNEQQKLRNILRILIAEKPWEASNGFFVTEEMKVTVAAQAALLLVGMDDHDYYHRVSSIVLHPDIFRRPDPEDPTVEDDVTDQVVEGLAVYRGPVVLSWERVLTEGREPMEGHNVVVHEFAHQLDFSDDAIDGTPVLASAADVKRWAKVMTAAIANHREELDSGREDLFFSEQAGESETEFFADASEAFYCVPHDLHAENAELYGVLANYYRVDPRTWFAQAPT